MGTKTEFKNEKDYLDFLRSGRDEMNLLEHSISGADSKPDKSTSSLVFAREDKHPVTGQSVERSWKITFSSEFGRPTPKDDDVVVALMKISQAAGLMNKSKSRSSDGKVCFTSYQILKILGWPDKGGSYKAIDDALNRVGGVWIVAKNYWYDNETKEYVDRKFGIIDDVFLYERDKYLLAKRRASSEGVAAPKSWIRWSEVMTESFESGYVTKLDIAAYRSIKNPVGRKLYRYLGKHFWNKSKHTVQLKTLCHEKLGYRVSESRNSKLIEKVTPAIKELEALGLYGLSHQFSKSYGKCKVVFEKGRKQKSIAEPITESLNEKLIRLGISKRAALSAIDRLTEERILEDIADAAYRAENGLLKSSMAGCLYSMLQSEQPWGRPAGFRMNKPKAKGTGKRKIAEIVNLDKLRSEKNSVEFEQFLGSLTQSQLEKFKEDALDSNSMVAKRYAEALSCGSQKIANEYLLGAMRLRWMRVAKERAESSA